MNDTISRAKAIEALDEYFERIGKLKRRGLNKGEKAISLDTVGAIKSLPPTQPERIIHCKDCEWWTKQERSPQGRCALSGMYPTGGWFCGNARMREVTT